MVKLYKSTLLFSLTLFISCSSNQGRSIPYNSFKADKVVIVIVDGPRYSETWGDSTHQYIPHMFNEMAKEGAVFNNFYNDGVTLTNPGHTAIVTGYRQMLDNTGKELPRYPSIFQYYLKESGKEKSSAWIIASKDKLEVLANTSDSKWTGKYQPSTDCGNSGLGSGYRDDKVTLTNALSHLKSDHPNVVLISFKEPDISGHAGDWQGYLKGIKDTDAYVYELWKFIRTDSIYKDRTAFLVTNDHGRHLDGVKDGFRNHGCSCEGCRHINFYAYGPDFKKGVFENKFAQQDLTATIAFILKLQMPHSEGNIIEPLFNRK